MVKIAYNYSENIKIVLNVFIILECLLSDWREGRRVHLLHEDFVIGEYCLLRFVQYIALRAALIERPAQSEANCQAT